MSKQKVNAVPAGYHSITPYLTIKGAAAKAIDFYKKVFGAIEEMRFNGPDGKIGHAELRIGDSKIMLGDEFEEMLPKGPLNYNNSAVGIHLYIEDVDAVVKKAVENGAQILQPLENKFYGDRSATIEDPFGHTWSISTHIEDVSYEETQERAKTQGKKLLNLETPEK